MVILLLFCTLVAADSIEIYDMISTSGKHIPHAVLEIDGKRLGFFPRDKADFKRSLYGGVSVPGLIKRDTTNIDSNATLMKVIPVNLPRNVTIPRVKIFSDAVENGQIGYSALTTNCAYFTQVVFREQTDCKGSFWDGLRIPKDPVGSWRVWFLALLRFQLPERTYNMPVFCRKI